MEGFMPTRQKLSWMTEKRKVKDLIPFDKNPRVLSDFQKEKLKESLIKFNLVDIPILDKDNVIISGNQRVKVLLLLGRSDEEIDVRVPNRKLTKKEIEEYNLKSNLHNGEWDFEALKSLEIETLMNAGFSDDDLSKIWDSNLETEDDNFQVEQELSKIKEPKTKPGDLIILGNHRLLCADSTDPKMVDKLVGNNKINVLNYDPIYNIGLDYDNGIGTNGKYGGKTNDKKNDSEYKEFLKKTLQNGLNHCLPDAHAFCWCDERYIGMLQSIYSELGIENKRVCLWVKNNSTPTPQVAFSKVFESCVYGTIGSPFLSSSIRNLNEILNKEIGSGNRLTDDILDLFNIWLVSRVNAQDYLHPTQKPVSLYEKPLRRCTKVGDIVLDLFAGSGTQMVSCEQLKRRLFMCEIEPKFCDLIVSRYKLLTNKEVEYVN
jgi:DNA modification methylase